MKIKKTIATILFLAAASAASNAAITIYNQNNDPTSAIANGNYRGFNLTLNNAAFTNTFTSPDGPTLGATITLKSIEIREGNSTGSVVDHYMQIFSTNTTTSPLTFGSSGLTWVASSSNTNQMNSGGAANNTFNFADILLSTSQNYIMLFTTTATAITGFEQATSVRLNVSNNAADTYTNGNLWNTVANTGSSSTLTSQDTAHDAVFVVNAIPEPTAALLGGLGLLTLLRRRRN